jgi:hypothetical protein
MVMDISQPMVARGSHDRPRHIPLHRVVGPEVEDFGCDSDAQRTLGCKHCDAF